MAPGVALLLLAFQVLLVWIGWRVCQKVGWPGPYALLLLVPWVSLIFVLTLLWKALPRTGHNRWWAVLAVVPLVTLGMLVTLAFSRWPEEDFGRVG